MLVRDITVQKTDIMAEAEVSRKLKDNRVLTMKNNRLTMECSRIEIATNALRLKIDQINDLIANVDEEARLDKEAIDALEEEKREVTSRQEEEVKENRMRLTEIVKLRRTEVRQSKFELTTMLTTITSEIRMIQLNIETV